MTAGRVAVEPVRVRDVIVESFSGPSPTCVERNVWGDEWGVLRTTASTIDRGWDWRAHKLLPRSYWGQTAIAVKSGDTIITKAGPRHRVGVPAFVDEIPAHIIPSGKMVCLRPDHRKIDPGYLALALLKPATRRFLNQRTTGMAESQVNFENHSLLNAPLWLPGRAEQERVTGSLNDVGALVASLEQLIAKKRRIKQGMMQQLLTGRTRLPGFTGAWKSRRLGDHLVFLRNVALSRAQLDSTSPLRYLHYGDIHTRESCTLDTATEAMPRASATLAGRAGRLQVGDLVFADASEDVAGIGKSVEIVGTPTEGAVPGLHTITARFDKQVLANGFKAYLQFNPAFRGALLRLASGTKVLATTRSFVAGIEMEVPEVGEQRAIAKVLREAEAEIDALQRRLDTTRAIKQGMMQELLTGRTRLGVEGDAA